MSYKVNKQFGWAVSQLPDLSTVTVHPERYRSHSSRSARLINLPEHILLGDVGTCVTDYRWNLAVIEPAPSREKCRQLQSIARRLTDSTPCEADV